jgi:type IV pilus assembly protein PilX
MREHDGLTYSKSQAATQRGVVLIFALLVLLSLTLMGVASVSSSMIQHKMAYAMEQQLLAFNAAESALAATISQSAVLDNSMIDPLSEAGKIAAIDLSVDALRCFSDQGYVSRTLTQNGLQTEKHHITNGQYDRQSRLNSWSLSAFVQARACRGSSSVMGSADIQCHVFLIRGCGQIKDNQYAVANTLSVSVMTSVLP